MILQRFFHTSRKTNTILVASLAVLLLFATGCTMPMSVKYSPLAAAESLSTDETTPPRAFVVRFADDRENTARTGSMKNIYGFESKTLVTTDDLGVILAEASTDALRKGGLKANLHTERTSGEAVPASELKGYAFVFGGRIKSIEVVSQPGWNTFKVAARVVIDACVTKAGKTEWIGPIEGSTEKREMIYSSSSLTDALDVAMQNCMRNMVRHLKASGSLQ
jgi:hypothetical protein